VASTSDGLTVEATVPSGELQPHLLPAT